MQGMRWNQAVLPLSSTRPSPDNNTPGFPTLVPLDDSQLGMCPRCRIARLWELYTFGDHDDSPHEYWGYNPELNMPGGAGKESRWCCPKAARLLLREAWGESHEPIKGHRQQLRRRKALAPGRNLFLRGARALVAYTCRAAGWSYERIGGLLTLRGESGKKMTGKRGVDDALLWHGLPMPKSAKYLSQLCDKHDGGAPVQWPSVTLIEEPSQPKREGTKEAIYTLDQILEVALNCGYSLDEITRWVKARKK